jgi:integrase
MGLRPWIVFPRSSGKKKPSYYVAFLNPETGDYNKRRSLKAEDPLHPGFFKRVTTRQLAEIEAQKLWESGAATSSREELGAYLKGFWAPEGRYVSGRSEQGRKLAVKYQRDMHTCISMHVVPWLQKPEVYDEKLKRWMAGDGIENLAIDRWTPGHAEDLMMYLRKKKELTPKRTNDVRKAIAVALGEWWKRKGQKERNPMRVVSKYHEEVPKRLIFSAVEVHNFFAQKMDPRIWAINALAATGGLRLGECLGLAPDQVKREELGKGKGKVVVYEVEIREKSNWQAGEGLKDPKWKSFGSVPIPSRVGEALTKLIAANRFENGFVFYGASPEYPIDLKKVEEEFARICAAIGIPEEERRRRKLTFHAWRHWYEAQYRGKIPDHVLREQMRHKSLKMTERYSHVTEEQANLVKQIASGIF